MENSKDKNEQGKIIGYVTRDTLTDFNGILIASGLKVVSSCRMPRSFVGSRMYAYQVNVNGKGYHGRGFGEGMSLVLHANKS